MKKIFLFILAIFTTVNGYSCITCNREVQEGIYNSMFYPNLFFMLSAFIVLGIIVAVLTRLATKRYRARLESNPDIKELASVPLMSAAMVIGIGVGGFVDGIVFHQILQWHEMLTNKIPADNFVNKSVNMFWDGIFHSFTLIVTIIGVYLLWKLLQNININRSGYVLIGGMAAGWGLFNVVEGIIDHHILALHNVRELVDNQAAWNYGFLTLGVVLIILGWLWIKKGEKYAKIA